MKKWESIFNVSLSLILVVGTVLTWKNPTLAEGTTYRDGYTDGVKRGRLIGEYDAYGNWGMGAAHENATCRGESSSEDYNRGFRDGCRKTYMPTFRTVRSNIIKQNYACGCIPKSSGEEYPAGWRFFANNRTGQTCQLRQSDGSTINGIWQCRRQSSQR